MKNFDVKVAWKSGLCLNKATRLAQIVKDCPTIDVIFAKNDCKAKANDILQIVGLEAAYQDMLNVEVKSYNGLHPDKITELQEKIKKLFTINGTRAL